MRNAAERWSDGIAIVGMSARFPGCRSVHEYWAKVVAGESLLTEPTDEELHEAGIGPDSRGSAHLVRSGTVLEDAESFDAKFFELSRREAELMDPQQRILLEVAYEALEHAGIKGDGERVGVFAGVGMNTYMLQLLGNPEMLESAGAYQLMLGNDKDFAASRVAYKLNLKGPAVVVQTACSTSLAAVHLACLSLLAGECDAALAGGVSVSFPQTAAYPYIPGMILSPDGVCRPFDEKAHGTVPGRGAGLVVLKRVADAVRDGDEIYAVIAGSAWNNDGAEKVGYTAPSVTGQAEAIAAAYRTAGVDPAQVRYVEAHGTGTELGDPIEIAALHSVLGNGATCVLGAVKSNMGHADVAAGVAGLIKAAMVVKTGVIPPTLHFEKANPALGLDETRLQVSGERQQWPEGERFAGVSSFGIGGTNVHLCLRAASLREVPVQDGELSVGPWAFPVSAKTPGALEAGCGRLGRFIEEDQPELGAVAATLQAGRRVFGCRRVVLAGNAGELAAGLGEIGRIQEPGANSGTEPAVAFLFPGQGLQFRGMARELYRRDEAFHARVEAGLKVLPAGLAEEIRAAICEEAEEDTATMRTGLAQPLLFLVEYALAVRWMDGGVRPAALVGHSLGELTAAAVAGVFAFEDGLRLAAERGRLMEATPEGAMLAVSLAADEVGKELASHELSEDLWIAAENGPRLTVVSGAAAAMEVFAAKMAARRVATMRVRTDRAFHTPGMAEAAERFAEAVAAVERKVPRMKWLSNVTGGWITAEEAVSARYWADQMTARVRFRENAAVLAGTEKLFLLEVGPGDALAGMVKATARVSTKGGSVAVAASTLGGAKRGGNDYEAWLEAAARLWESGVELDWSRLPGYPGKRKTGLPGYAFERERFWVERTAVAASGERGARAAGEDLRFRLAANGQRLTKREDMATWFYAPTWRKMPAVGVGARAIQVTDWVMLGIGSGAWETELAAELEAAGRRVYRLSQVDRAGLDAFWQERREAEGIWGLIDLRSVAGQANQDGLYGSLLAVLQAATRARVRFAQVELIASGLVEVFGERVEAPGLGVVEGLARMLPVELPGTRVRVIDPGYGAELASAAAVVSELGGAAPDGVTVALRKGARWQEEWLPVRLEGGQATRFRQGGVYLITGGLGGVGFVMARRLVELYGAKVALLGRTELPERELWESWLTERGPAEATSVRIARMKELEEAARKSGGAATLVFADVADRTGMAAAWAAVEEKFGSSAGVRGVIHGVIHAAGLGANERLMTQTDASVERVLSPKVQGSEVLAELSAGKQLDFLMFCSSISAVHPIPGAAPYAAANAFQDRYAVWCREHLGVPAVSINLDRWRNLGMAADDDLPEEFADLKRALQAKAMSAEEGIEVIERVLATGEARMLVSTLDLVEVLRDTAAQVEGARPVESADENQEQTEETLAVMAIWRELLGAEWVAPGDNFFELGGHSLLGTMVLARIRERFGVELTIRAIFEAPTPVSLGERIQEAAPVEEEPAHVGGEREEFEI